MSEAATQKTTRLCVLLACFSGRKVAGRTRSEFVKRLQSGGHLVDDVVLTVDAKRRAKVYDPRRVVAGTLTAALTWGVFGLVADGNLRGLIVWGVLGAICGGLFAYSSEHILAKSDLANIGKQLKADSSAIVAFVESNGGTQLMSAAPKRANVTSAVAIDADLSSRDATDAAATSDPAALSMTLLRYDGEHSARKAVASLKDAATHVELLVEVAPSGRTRVVDPTQGAWAWSRSDIISWGLFGVAFGFLAGFFGNGGILDALDRGIVTGIAWALFGLVAGALYGLWAGRATSTRRIRGLRPLLPKDSSTAVVWISGASTDSVTQQIGDASRHVSLYFHPTARGAVLQTK
jgi:hypothetical protein